MEQRSNLSDFSEFSVPISQRRQRGVYFLRIAGYTDEISQAIWQYHELARQRGVIIEGQITNPDERQLNYYKEIMGESFSPDDSFVAASLSKWMPRMSTAVREEFSKALSQQFADMRAKGKTESILKSTYIKMMCWLYYKFERLTPFLGEDDPPRVLYEGSNISNHELIFLRTLSSMGADILLLETGGDTSYLKLDPSSAFSQLYSAAGQGPFPAEYSLKTLRKQMSSRPVPAPAPGGQRPVQNPPSAPARGPVPPPHVQVTPRTPAQRPVPTLHVGTGPQTPPAQRPVPSLHVGSAPQTPASQPGFGASDPEKRFTPPQRSACTNAWMKKAELNEVLTPPVVRGDDHTLFYNVFIRLFGVQDKLTYANELYQLYQNLQANQRKVCIVDGVLPAPEPEEIQKIRRHNYRTVEEMIVDLAGNIPASASVELQRNMQQAFVRTMKFAARSEPNLNRLTSSAVYLLCWIHRYQGQIFQGWKETDIPCFIKMGACETANEALFPYYLSQLPVDVLIFAPNLNQPCALTGESLLEITGSESLPLMAFPKQNGALTMRTAASHAEQDLTGILYSDTGMYRNRQFDHAETITLQTTYDEIFILWDQELKYRPNFSTANQIANIPVIFAKISGVPNGKMTQYWQKVKNLADARDTLLIKQFPMISPEDANQFQSLAVKCIKNNKLKRDEIKASRQYPFGLLREEMQEHILDKIQQMLDERTIKGTFVNGTEYTVVSTVLNMKKELLRLIQGFDFTKRNPKIVVINTRDLAPTLQDAIMLTFLNKLGFDIAMFIPTGYQTIERFLDGNHPIEHQVGDYMYDQNVPDLSTIQTPKGPAWLNNILRRGN